MPNSSTPRPLPAGYERGGIFGGNDWKHGRGPRQGWPRFMPDDSGYISTATVSIDIDLGCCSCTGESWPKNNKKWLSDDISRIPARDAPGQTIWKP